MCLKFKPSIGPNYLPSVLDDRVHLGCAVALHNGFSSGDAYQDVKSSILQCCGSKLARLGVEL